MASLDMVMDMPQATHTEAPRVCMDTMEDMAMEDMDMARGLLSQDMVMLSATTTEAPRVFMDTMEVMDMVVITARDLLSQDIMVVPALLSTRAVLTTMDLMAMVSTTMVRSADAGYYGYGVAGSYQQVNRPYSVYGVSVAHPY